MTIKKNAKKPVLTNKSQLFNLFAAPLHQVESCIGKDYLYLSKAYPKTLIEVEKAISRTTKAVEKTKKQRKGSKLGVKKMPISKADLASLDSLEKELDALKNIKKSLASDQKVFFGRQKAVQQFDKMWAKKIQLLAKGKKTKAGQRTKKQKSARQAKDIKPIAPAIMDRPEEI